MVIKYGLPLLCLLLFGPGLADSFSDPTRAWILCTVFPLVAIALSLICIPLKSAAMIPDSFVIGNGLQKWKIPFSDLLSIRQTGNSGTNGNPFLILHFRNQPFRKRFAVFLPITEPLEKTETLSLHIQNLMERFRAPGPTPPADPDPGRPEKSDSLARVELKQKFAGWWSVFGFTLNAIGAGIGLLAFGFLADHLALRGMPPALQGVVLLGFLFFVFCAPLIAYQSKKQSYKQHSFRFYSDRLEYTRGTRHVITHSIALDQIHDVHLTQNPIQKRLGLGSIILKTSRLVPQAQITIPDIENPRRIYEAIKQGLDSLSRAQNQVTADERTQKA